MGTTVRFHKEPYYIVLSRYEGEKLLGEKRVLEIPADMADLYQEIAKVKAWTLEFGIWIFMNRVPNFLARVVAYRLETEDPAITEHPFHITCYEHKEDA